MKISPPPPPPPPGMEWNGMELGLLGLSASLLAGRIQSNPPQDVDPSGPPGPGQTTVYH